MSDDQWLYADGQGDDWWSDWSSDWSSDDRFDAETDDPWPYADGDDLDDMEVIDDAARE